MPRDAIACTNTPHWDGGDACSKEEVDECKKKFKKHDDNIEKVNHDHRSTVKQIATNINEFLVDFPASVPTDCIHRHLKSHNTQNSELIQFFMNTEFRFAKLIVNNDGHHFHANTFEHCSSACILTTDATHCNREGGELKKHCKSAFAWGSGANHNERNKVEKACRKRKFEALAQQNHDDGVGEYGDDSEEEEKEE